MSTLSITSRGIGISTAQLTYAVASSSFFENVSIPEIYTQYRVYLALFEAKLINASYLGSVSEDVLNNTYKPHCTGLFQNFSILVNALTPTPLLIKRIIDALGVVEHTELQYIPAVAKLCRDAEKNLLPRPETTLLSNLRETVEALANPKTPLDIRRGYEQHCPIPGAIWLDHILQNPDEIIPENYSYDNGLSKDICTILLYFKNLKRHAPEMFGGCLSVNKEGRRSIFVSNKMGTLRCPNRNQGEELNHYYARCIVEGNIEKYSSLHKLTPAEQLEGQIILLGELPELKNLIYPIYMLRHEAFQPYIMMDSYYNIFSFLGMYNGKLNNLDDGFTPQQLRISVTSRGIGFVTAYLTFSAYRDSSRGIPSIYAQYRAYLALLEERLRKFSLTICDHLLTRCYSELNQLKALVPSPIKRVVDAIGEVKHNGKTYIPALAKLCRDAKNNLQPQPETTLLSNLRETVEALSRAETPLNIRINYEQYCPIPGVIWQDHILQNPDEIIPENYTYEGLSKDIYMILPYLKRLCSVTPRMLPHCSANYRNGRKSIFVSNKMASLRCPDRIPGQELNDYYFKCIPQAKDVVTYWGLHKLTPEEQLEGQANFIGEIPKIENVVHSVYVLRHPEVQAYSMCSDYRQVCQLLYK